MRNMRTTTRILLPAAGLAGLVALGGGCKSSTSASINHDPTPALDTLSQTDFEVENALVLQRETNFRMIWEDLGRIWMTDRPSRLSPKPIPY